MNVALVGPTCAGKTTCASILCQTFELRHLSTGQVLRENRSQQTALGILTRKYVEMGELVPDEIINAMIEEAVRKTAPDQGLMLDGFPSTLYQARFLDELFKTTGRALDAVVWMQIPETLVFDRAARRLTRRPDDRPEILRHRLQVFRRTTGPVLDYYHQQNRLHYLEASGSVESVSSTLADIFRQIHQHTFQPRVEAAQQALLESLLSKPDAGRTAAFEPSLDIIVMGAPGSGKGTRASFLAEHLQIPHIATGDLFRENFSGDSILGKIAQTYIDRGELVPDDVTEAMVRERLNRPDAHEGYILDGFPRTLSQAEALDEIMEELKRKVDCVVFVVVPDEEIVRRISGRRLCPVCQASYHVDFKKPKVDNVCDADGSPLFQREDDDPQTVRSRLKVFHGQTMPVIDYYRQAGLLMEVPGSGDMAQMKQAMLSVVKQIKRR